jgi:hypothetical protein
MDLIIDLYSYFSRFVPKNVLRDMFIQPEATQNQGYSEIKAGILAAGNGRVIDQIQTFVVSINENYLSQRIKNSKGIILFVEYGKINVNHEQMKGIQEALAVTVASDLSTVGNDNLNEILLMNECWIILDSIIRSMQAEQETLEFCGNSQLITYPVEVQPVDPVTFYGRGGWCAMFNNSKTML